MNTPISTDDPHHLARFVQAQDGVYEQALSEVRAGRKRSHWMWFVFPQIAGLGSSSTAQFFAIQTVAEARAYRAHPLLGPRLQACMAATLAVEGRTARDIFGSPDDLKLRSCATLFAAISPPGSVFEQVLAKYYHAEPDAKTIELLKADGGNVL